MFFVGGFTVEMVPHDGVEEPAVCVPNLGGAGMCLLEKICVLDELPLGVSYSAVGHEFSVNGSTMYIK